MQTKRSRECSEEVETHGWRMLFKWCGEGANAQCRPLLTEPGTKVSVSTAPEAAAPAVDASATAATFAVAFASAFAITTYAAAALISFLLTHILSPP